MRCDRLLVVAVSVAIGAGAVRAELLPNGVLNDEQTSIVYDPDNGEIAVDVPAGADLVWINIDSPAGIFVGLGPCTGGPFNDFCANTVYVSALGHAFGVDWRLGSIAQAGFTQDFILEDLTVAGSFGGGGGLGPVDLVYRHDLFPGDANRDFSFDQLDIVQVLQAGKYFTDESATWGEGDWNSGPGGYPGEPSPGDGLFDQKDIVAALQTGAYLSGAYAAISPGGVRGDEQTSIIYDARTGQIAVDAPFGATTDWDFGGPLTSINIDSATGILTGDQTICSSLQGGSFVDNCTSGNIFLAKFGSSFGSLSFGNMAQIGLNEDFVAKDLTVVGSLAGGGDLGPVDLIYIPEPSTFLLAALGLVGLLAACRLAGTRARYSLPGARWFF